jgi:MFS family permease
MNDRRRYASLGVIAFTLALAYGVWYSYSVIMVALLREFGWSRSVLAGAFSLFTLVQGVANPLIGSLCDRLRPERLVAAGGVALALALFGNSFISSPWQLYLSFGLFTALAVAASGWVPALVQVQRRFADRVGLGVGIASAGVGIGMTLVVPLCQLLIDAFGWRTAYRVHALACIAFILPSTLYLMRTAPGPGGTASLTLAEATLREEATLRVATRSMTLIEAMRTTPFWLVMAAFFLGNVCSQTLHVHQVAYLVDHGVAAIVAASVVGVVGLSSIIGKIGSGWLSDRIEREFVYVAGVAIMVASVAVLTAAGAALSQSGAYLYAIMLGAGYSVTAAITPVMANDRFSGKHFGAIVGFGLFSASIGSALGPWLGGFLFDVTGSYALPFAIAASCGVLAAGAGWAARTLRVRTSAAFACRSPSQ